MSDDQAAHAVQEAAPGAVRADVSWEDGGTILCFMNEVAGGRRLLEAVRARIDAGAERVAVVAPQNQPTKGQIVDREEVRDAARSRVEVTEAVLAEFGIDAVGAVLDPLPSMALDDAVRAFQPKEVLLSCLAETRFGITRKDLVTWAEQNIEVPVTHIPVRVDDDAVRWDVVHTLVVATRTVAAGDLIARLKQRAAERPHRYTFISPASGDVSREDVCENLATTLAELYRSGVDATGQPMSPAAEPAIRNAIEHYRVDEILIATLAGQESAWLSEGLVEKTEEFSNKPVEHFEVGSGAAAHEPVGAGSATASSASGGEA
ncbi:hypothetical protein HJD18_10665 [Thermoleophilia bacterium SCSIO 60948]|nr:hypothetical protein HJD18_10665 [Thermoleophilia bacterium SCSIO 60948]